MEKKSSIFSMASTSTPSMFILMVLTLLTIPLCKWLGFLRYRQATKVPPGPTSLPVLGGLFQMITNRPIFRWIHGVMDEMETEIVCICLGRVRVIVVSSPELAREFLRKQDVIFASRPRCMSGEMTSNGYLTAALTPLGDQWKKMRRVLSSEVLSPAKHRWFHDKRLEEANHLVLYVYNQCKKLTSNGLVNVRIAVRQYCGNVIRKMVFNKRFFGRGMEDGGPGAEEEEHVAALFTILTYLYGFSIADFYPLLEIFDFDGHKRILKKAIDSITKYQNPEIEERVQIWKDGVKNIEEDILDILINLKDTFGNPLLSIEEIKAQIIEIMIATVDNPSNAIEWAIAEMLNQPKIFERALEELDSVVGRERLVQESDLPKLNFIKACAKEAFRLHPVAPFNVPHVSTKDTTVAGYFIPEGSHVLLSRPGLGRNPRIWDEPNVYKPERHLRNHVSEIVLVDPELNMLSFSTGRRGCAGVLLGSTMTAILLARLVHSFTWAIPPHVPKIDLVESESDLFMAKPLIAVATPRLPEHVYLQLQK